MALPLARADVSKGVTIASSSQRTLLPGLLLVPFLAGPAMAAEPLAIPLELAETANVARQAFPARASVPLPRGRVPDANAVRLVAPGGAEAPLQARALERWSDGSVRWLLLDFLADVPAGGHVAYTLRDGTAAAPGPRVRLQERAGTRHVETGVIRASVAGAGDALLRELSTGEQRLEPILVPALSLRDGASGRTTVERVVVETEGPIRTELLATGRYAAGLAYQARLAFFAGKPFVRVQHTVTNVGDARYLPLASLRLTVPGRFTQGTVGVDDGSRPLAPLDTSHLLRQDDAAPAVLDGARAGRHADGWMRATGDEVAVTLVAASFWQEYPKSLEVATDHVALDLFAGRDTPVQLGVGAAKTHEFWIALEPAASASRPADLAAALTAPLVAIPPAAWVVASEALPQALAPDAPGAREFLARLSTAYANYRQNVDKERWDDGPPVPCAARTVERARIGLYGALNWGDWQFPGYRDNTKGCDAWGNLEYDLPQVLALGWTATGSRAFLDGLVPAARHYRDVDIIHHAPEHAEWVGFNHPHKALHFASEAPGGVDLGHTWTEGLITFHRFTGEARALAAARGIGDVLTRASSKARNPRQLGWPMIALVALHDATGERRYLDAARTYADAARSLDPTPAAGDWKMGILADGLAAVHAATGDDGLRRWLVAYADAIVAEPARFPDPRFALPLGYLAATTGEARYAATALATARQLRVGNWGKMLAAMGRTGFRLLSPLQRVPDLAGRASALSPPPAPLARPKAPPRPKPFRDAPRRQLPPARRAP
jgi:hypothetical protein